MERRESRRRIEINYYHDGHGAASAQRRSVIINLIIVCRWAIGRPELQCFMVKECATDLMAQFHVCPRHSKWKHIVCWPADRSHCKWYEHFNSLNHMRWTFDRIRFAFVERFHMFSTVVHISSSVGAPSTPLCVCVRAIGNVRAPSDISTIDTHTHTFGSRKNGNGQQQYSV